MGLLDYNNFVLNEGSNNEMGINNVPQVVIDLAKKKRKDKKLLKFISNIPTEALPSMQSLFTEISQNTKWQEEFITNLYEFEGPDGIDSSYYTAGSLGSRIFDLKPAGMGRGEIFLSWLIKNSEAQGGGKSFDLQVGKSKYEVKDYRDGNSGIKLGVKGNVANYLFWNEIVKTIGLIDALTMQGGAGITPFDIKKHFNNKDFVDSLKYINSRRVDIKGKGAFTKTDKKAFETFYQTMGSVEYVPDEYTAIELRGPGVNPIVMSIKPISASSVQSGQFDIQFVKSAQSDKDYILTNLRRLAYVRDPSQFDKDIQDAVNKATSGTNWIVFRKTGIKQPTSFKYDRVSQSIMRVIETDIKDSEIEDVVD
jgi:hypothetical protein